MNETTLIRLKKLNLATLRVVKKIYDFVNWRGLLQSLRIEVLCSEKDNDLLRVRPFKKKKNKESLLFYL